MGHWTEKWLGRPYVAGQHDCLDFARDVLLDEFSIEIRIPHREATGLRGFAREIAELGGDVATPIVAGLREGDGVLMSKRGWQRGGHHVGLWTAPGGTAHVLHCIKGLGSVLWPLHGLQERGWQMEGCYRWL